MTDLLISYSRQDGEFVRQLHADLSERGRDVWVDFEDIPASAAWWESINDAIEETNAFVFVISPDSVGSPICNLEIDEALNNHKRLIPILLRPTNLDEALAIVEQRSLGDDVKDALDGRSITDMVRNNWNAIARHNWISFDREGEFTRNVEKLLTALDTDLEYVKEHTRLFVRANDWLERHRNPHLLLVGTEINEAEQWLAHAVEKDPKPTSLHAEYISKSRQFANTRQRRRFVLLTVGFVVSIALSVLASFLAFYANGQRTIAVENANAAATAQAEALFQADVAATNAAVANTNAARANSLLWSSYARQSLADGDSALALALALEAANIQNPPALAQQTLAAVAYAPGPRRRIDTGSRMVNEVAFSPDGRFAALGLAEQRVLIVDLATGDTVHTFEDTGGLVATLAYSPVANTLLVAAVNNLTLLDVGTGEIIRTMQHGSGTLVQAVTISPDGTRALSGALNRNVMLWDLETGEAIHTLSGHIDAVNTVAFSPDGTQALSGGQDDIILLWDLDKGVSMRRFNEQSGVFSVAFSPGGQTMVSGTQLGSMTYWNVEEGEILHHFGEEDGMIHTLPVQRTVFHPGGSMVLSGAEDGRVILWNVVTGQAQRVFDAHDAAVNSVAFSPDGSTALSGGAEGVAYWWSITTDVISQQFAAEDGHASEILSAVYSPDGSELLASSRDGHKLLLWDVASGTVLNDYFDPTRTEPINAVAFTADGEQFVTASNDGTLSVWDKASGEVLATFDGHENPALAVAVNPDGTQVLSGDDSGGVYLWDLETGEAVRQFSDGSGEVGHRRDVLSIAFSEDGAQALTGSEDRTMILWDVRAGTPVRTYEGQGGRVLAVGFYEETLYSATNSDTLFVWDVESTTPRTAMGIGIEGEDRTTSSVAFNPAGTLALIGRTNGSMSLWDIRDTRSIADYNLGTGSSRDQVTSLAFHPSGDAAVVGTRRDTLVQVRTLALTDLVRWARDNRSPAAFTCEERETYNITPPCDTE